MFATLLSTTFFFGLVIQGILADLQIDTPTVVQCQSTQFTWAPSQPPYNLIIVPAADPCGNTIVDLGDTNDTSLTWIAALNAGSEVMLSLEDVDGNEAWSGSITVQGSNDYSCLPSSSSSTSSSTTSSTAIPSTTLKHTTSASKASTTTTSIFTPAGAANAGINPLSSGALAFSPLGATTMLGTALAAAFAFSL